MDIRRFIDKRVLPLLLAAGLFAPVFAAPAPVAGASPFALNGNYIEKTGLTAVNLHVGWGNASLAGIKMARALWIGYTEAGGVLTPFLEEYFYASPILDTAGVPTGSYRDISSAVLPIEACGFQNDILYQIKIELFGSVDMNNIDLATGMPLGVPSGLPRDSVETVYMHGVTVTFNGIENSKLREMKPGERETGYNPALACSFKTPRVYVNSEVNGGAYAVHASGSFLPIFGGDPGDPGNLGYQTALRAIQKFRPGITEMVFIIGLEDYISVRPIQYSPLKEISFYWDPAGAGAFMCQVDFGGVPVREVYRAEAANSGGDLYRIYLSGRQDADTAMPSDADWNDLVTNPALSDKRDEYIPSSFMGPDSFTSVLRHKEIYPGSQYRMHAEIHYMAGGDRLLEGSGFEVTGNMPSRVSYTMLRIIVSKISDEYVKVDVFRVNQGNDYVVDNGYRVTVRPETGQADMVITITDFESDLKSLQAYIKVTNPIVRHYFRASYTRSTGATGPDSAWIPYTLQESGDNAPVMPKGLMVEKLEYDPVRRITDVTISWDRPANWATATSNDIYMEFNLNTSNAEIQNIMELTDGEGGSYGEFAALYRTVLAVRREEIQTPAANRLSYTIKGDELFNVIYGAPQFGPPAAVLPPGGRDEPTGLYDKQFWDFQRELGKAQRQVELYPDFLLPNTRYFLTLRTVLWLNDAGDSYVSNTSSPAAFTTFPTRYTPPLPYIFSVTDNAVPAPPDFINSVSLQNSGVDWRYATTVYNPPIPVHYELYISDRPDDGAPQLAGVSNFNADGTPYESWGADPAWMGSMRLPPYDASDPMGLAKALVAARPVTSASGAYINWDGVKLYNGEKLQPNKVYYFWIRTYIVENRFLNGAVVGINGNSAYSVMLSVTTPPWPQGSDDTYMRRIAPVDFAIARDSSGNLRISGDIAVFEWQPTAPDTVYEFIITSVRDVNGYFMAEGLHFGDPALAPGMDSTYESFIREFMADDGRGGDRRLLLDPQKAGVGDAAGGIRGFYRDPVTGTFTYTVDRWLFPNSLYYASLRAAARDPDPDGAGGGAGGATDPARAAFYTEFKNTSPFVTVPLTTLMLDAPFNLKPVDGAELWYSFRDTSIYMAADYRVYLRGGGSAAYSPVGGAQSTIVKTGGFVYGKIINLEFGAVYDVRVTRGQEEEQAYQEGGFTTRDRYHNVQVEWMGPATEPNDAFLRYQIAIISQTELDELPPDQADYFELSDIHLAPSKYVADGREYSYEISENPQTINTPGTMLYRATILSKPTRLRDGSVIQRQLEPNMRYYIKVRTRKISRDDANVSAFSKYAGPVDARTDFLQSSQDEKEEQRRLEDNLLDKLAEYERETFYIADAGDRSQGKFLLKEDKIIGMLRTSASAGYLIDVSDNAKKADADTIYIPGGVLLALQEFNKTITIRLDGVEYIFTQNTIDLRYDKKYTDMAAKAGSRDFMVRLRDSRAALSGAVLPVGNTGLTAVHRLEAAVIASNRSYANIANIIEDYIFNERTGLLNQKLNALSLKTIGSTASGVAGAGASSGVGSGANASAALFDSDEAQNRELAAEQARRAASDAYVQELADDIKNQVSNRIGDILEGRNGFRPIAMDMVNVDDFNAPLIATLAHAQSRGGRVSPLISYDSKEWFKLTQNITQRPSSISFEALAPGYYSAVLAEVSTAGLAEGSYDEDALIKVASRYDLSDIFAGINRDFQPDLPVLNREALLLYERVMGLEGDTFGMNIPQKITALGLQDVIRPGAQNAQMERQRAAVLLSRLYAGRRGIGGGLAGGLTGGPGDSLAAGSGRGALSDALGVDASCLGAVEFCVGRGIMKLSAGKFEPGRAITRAELIFGIAEAMG